MADYYADLRREYAMSELSEHATGNNPISFFKQWLEQAIAANIPDANAMTLATVDAQGMPHARIVLLKELDALNSFLFFTNYESAKAMQIEPHGYVALLFYWKELERQVRIEGIAERTEAVESDNYFASRPPDSQIGAWASPQSRKIPSRHALEQAVDEYKKRYEGNAIPRPPHWGGYRVIPHSIEFWQGRPNRLHDRVLFTYNNTDEWAVCRLAP